MERTYGYCRISRKEQSIERQIRNITGTYPNAIIKQEAFTGTKVYGRKEFEKLVGRVEVAKTKPEVVEIKKYKNGKEKRIVLDDGYRVIRFTSTGEVQPGDTIVFDSVSRMSRNADDGMFLYMELYKRGINLVFLKEPAINTECYKSTVQIAKTGTDADIILEGVNKYLMVLAEKQIRAAFEQAQKEVDDDHARTREGIETARRNGKQIGRPMGRSELNADGSQSKAYANAEAVKKAIVEAWKKYPDMKHNDVMKLVGVSRGTYFKYKKELETE